jgi:5'-nucleotidase
MKFLLVNDDGINSERFKFTEEILTKHGDVIVFAPMFEQSGKSMAISTNEIAFEKIDKNHYAVNGTPVDCVNLAIQGFNISPDLVISGINKGFNIGIDVFYSGTVGACFQANYLGYPTIAFSGSFNGDNVIHNYFEKTLKFVLDETKYHSKHILNVNFPKDGIKPNPEIIETEPYYQITRLEGKIKDNRYSFKRNFVNLEPPKNSDLATISQGDISINVLGPRFGH